MIVDSMSKTEVMLSLQKEFKGEILPYYFIVRKEIEKTVLPRVQRTGQPEKVEKGKKTSGNNLFHLIFKVTKHKYEMTAYSEFFWNGRHCYAYYFENESIVVFQSHCLERYAERVLKQDIEPKEVFKKHLTNKQNCAFQISLQSPKHERCQYLGLANALFLGDYDEPTMDNKDFSLHWYNTCISLKESHTSQSGILHSLSLMQHFVEELKFNPLDIAPSEFLSAQKELQHFINKSEANKQAYIDFLKRSYMLHQLQLNLQFPWISLYMEEINSRMKIISDELAKFYINTASLSPYGKEVGFAIKGEINYNP